MTYKYNSTAGPFSQDAARWICKNDSLFQGISEEQGYSCHCRNPRCSHTCRVCWASKEAACLEYFLGKLSPTHTLYRGNYRLPANATPADHAASWEKFSDLLGDYRSKHKIVIKIRAYEHVTDPANAHWDFVIYTAEQQGIADVIRDLAKQAGAVATCKRVYDRRELKGVCAYITKSKRRPGDGGDFIYLPSEGRKIVRGSTQFFGAGVKGVTREGRPFALSGQDIIWERLKLDWYGVESAISNNSPSYEDVVRHRINFYLPQSRQEAISLSKLAYLTSNSYDLVSNILLEMPDADITIEGNWYRRGVTAPIPWKKRCFKYGMPYHIYHFPLPDLLGGQAEEIAQPWEPRTHKPAPQGSALHGQQAVHDQLEEGWLAAELEKLFDE